VERKKIPEALSKTVGSSLKQPKLSASAAPLGSKQDNWTLNRVSLQLTS
jgi:hypothetical protein